MKILANFIQMAAFLGAGVYLLLHEHPIAGAFCLFVCACGAVTYTTEKSNDSDN